MSVNWTFARKNSNPYLPLSTQPPLFTPSHAKGRKDTRTYQSREHKVKAFAGDLTIITSNYSDHKKTLCSIDSHCLELDLMLRPEKCLILVLDLTLKFLSLFPEDQLLKLFKKNQQRC